MVGAFLMAVTAVLTFYAYSRSARPPRQLYVVATRDVAPGHRIDGSELRVVGLDIPDSGVRHQVFGSVGALIGASVLNPVSAGALIEATDVVGRGGSAGTRELSLELARSRAVGGTLKAGEEVDILGTVGSGTDSTTQVIAPHVRILTVSSSGGGSLGDAQAQMIVFAIPATTSAEAIVNASIANQVSLVRSAEQADSAPPAARAAPPGPARPARPAAAAAGSP